MATPKVDAAISPSSAPATSASSYPPFVVGGCRYDLSTYTGRFTHFFTSINPTYCFVGDKEIQSAKDEIAAFVKDPSIEASRRKSLWKSQEILNGVLHPQTQKPIFPLFRLCSFVPVNLPIVAGMLISPPTIANAVFWQWFNQSYNACFNYVNGNHSADEETSAITDATKKIADDTKSSSGSMMTQEQQHLLQAYGSAVAVSLTIAVGMGQALKKAKISETTRRVMQYVVPYCSVAGAGVFNAVLMRRQELTEGVEVEDEEGRKLGYSIKAAEKGLWQVAISRLVLPLPCLGLPAPFLALVARTPSIANNFLLKTASEMVIITGALAIAVPAAIAVFPQTMTIPIDALEPEFKNCKLSTGEPVKKVFVNKGL